MMLGEIGGEPVRSSSLPDPQPRMAATKATRTTRLTRTMTPALISVAVKLLFFAGMVLSFHSMSVSDLA